jgi:hypothetical protein
LVFSMPAAMPLSEVNLPTGSRSNSEAASSNETSVKTAISAADRKRETHAGHCRQRCDAEYGGRQGVRETERVHGSGIEVHGGDEGRG